MLLLCIRLVMSDHEFDIFFYLAALTTKVNEPSQVCTYIQRHLVLHYIL